jgi:hypothetical protein
VGGVPAAFSRRAHIGPHHRERHRTGLPDGTASASTFVKVVAKVETKVEVRVSGGASSCGTPARATRDSAALRRHAPREVA